MTIAEDGPHWRYALRVYGSEGVSSACVHLQDTHGVDVNVLLVALHAALEDGHAVGREEIAALDAAIAPQRENLVLPIRQIRRFLKPQPYGPGSEALRNAIKKAEILAEQFEQLHLARAASGFPRGGGTDAAEICRTVVTFFDPEAGAATHPVTRQCIETIAAAAEGKSLAGL